MTGWIVLAALGVAAVVTLPQVPRWLYHWRAAAHVVELTQSEPVAAPEYLPAPMPGGCACGVQSGEHKLWCGEELPPPLVAVFRRELHHVDAYEPGAAPAPETGAGDESEACGPPAPPAPSGAFAMHPRCPVEVWPGQDRLVLERLGNPIRTWLPPRTEDERARDALVENARVDAFIAAMRAESAAWLASARERWAAA